jgi:hypothetical protein
MNIRATDPTEGDFELYLIVATFGFCNIHDRDVALSRSVFHKSFHESIPATYCIHPF